MLSRLSTFRHVVPVSSSSSPRFSTSTGSRKNPHADWYAQILPSMIPVALLGSTVYIAFHLVQTHLSTERRAEEDQAKIAALETQLDILRQQQQQQQQYAALPSDSTQPKLFRWWWF